MSFGIDSDSGNHMRTRRPKAVQKVMGGWKLYLFVLGMLWFFKQSGHIVGELLYYGFIVLTLAWLVMYIRSIANSVERV